MFSLMTRQGVNDKRYLLAEEMLIIHFIVVPQSEKQSFPQSMIKLRIIRVLF